ncbi:MAG: citramalate synthase [Treponema sp.]|nr:citramalate synthase [Treponema sp.]
MVQHEETIEVELLDTTLRDGAQGQGISFSIQDKLSLVQVLDELGITWIEAGNPGSNPKDMEFFHRAKHLKLEHARLCAFGSTRKKHIPPKADPHLQSLLDAATETVVIFGKSWNLQVTDVLGVSLEENCTMIAETVAFLKEKGRTVIYDAEHFFDGWRAHPEYALKTLYAALEAGADRLVLCDTNGGNFPDCIAQGTVAALKLIPPTQNPPLVGIHAHNDADMASACSLTAVQAGCRHVQGTLLGFGERCGNTSLAAVIPSIVLKLGLRCLPRGKLEQLFQLSHRVAEIANVAIPDNMPYVGAHAFSHKGGMHADGILKVRRSFEHIDPSLVGNDRHFLMSEVGGRSVIAERVKKLDPTISKDHPVTAALALRLKALEAVGWQFEGADASFELLIRQELGTYKPLFKIDAYRVVSEHPSGGSIACAHAWAKVWVDGQHEIAAAEGDGPVNALDGALRRALQRFYPELEQVRLLDYKVRVIDGKDATAAKVRVLIESTDGVSTWNTVGVSEDIINASRAALVDSIEYKLLAVHL